MNSGPSPFNHYPSTTTEKTMKKLASLLIAACAACSGAYAQDDSEPGTRSALLPSHAGLHLVTQHSTTTANNTNPGMYVRWADATGTGPVAGSYYNSERNQSFYAAYSWNWRARSMPVSAGITAGAITGYSSAKVLPLLVPSAAVHWGRAAVKLTYVPKFEKDSAHALHLSVEVQF
jgi:hypothetical protein